jgi:hypothetical protein
VRLVLPRQNPKQGDEMKLRTYYVSFSTKAEWTKGKAAKQLVAKDENEALEKAEKRASKSNCYVDPTDFKIVSRSVANRIAREFSWSTFYDLNGGR